MPFNLVPPWNAGYALPKNVDVEGLQRGAFTTMQTPRGTYDDPTVGTGGYAVPRYVLDEGYGQGTFTTKWMPRGEYGPAVPNWIQEPTTRIDSKHRVRGGTEFSFDVLAGLGDDEVGSGAEAPAYQHGLRAARALLQPLNEMPAQYRQQALKTVLDQIDPGLWPKVAARGKKMEERGVASKVALERALGIEMTQGLAQELIRLGRTNKQPSPSSQVGLAMYGTEAAMGDINSFLQRQLRRAKHGAGDAASFTKRYAGKALTALKHLNCKALGQPIFRAAVDRRDRGHTGPAGAAAAQGSMAVVSNKTCPQAVDPALMMPGAAGAGGSFMSRVPWVPLLAVGGGVAVVYFATRKKGKK